MFVECGQRIRVYALKASPQRCGCHFKPIQAHTTCKSHSPLIYVICKLLLLLLLPFQAFFELSRDTVRFHLKKFQRYWLKSQYVCVLCSISEHVCAGVQYVCVELSLYSGLYTLLHVECAVYSTVEFFQCRIITMYTLHNRLKQVIFVLFAKE